MSKPLAGPSPTSDPDRQRVLGESAATRAFKAGDVVSDRYRIVRFVAEGGMGEVYEADDMVLRARVALKTLRLSSGATSASIERLRREISLARKIAHPNVCRVFDMGRHSGGLPGNASITYLTMELLEGETLANRISRQGRLSASDATPLVEQMVEGLAAAHREGVIHRDFKSSNVMLVPDESDPANPRAVLTDFGSARSELPIEGVAMTVTQTGAFIGTPAYMAPEQVAGAPVTAAADLYALGVVLYEMMTGRLPYPGESALSVAARRIYEAPVPPREIVPEMDRVWESVILKCLERDPRDRFRTAGEIVEALKRHRVVGLRRTRNRRWRVASIACIAMLAVIAVMLVIRFRGSRPGSPRGAPATSPRRSVAILPFNNASGSTADAWLSTALSEMLATELAAGGELRVVPGDVVARLIPDLPSSHELLDGKSLARIRSTMGADVIVTGTYAVRGDRIRLDIRAQDAASGLAMVPQSGNGLMSGVFSVVTSAGRRLRESLGASDASNERSHDVAFALPADPSAAKLYSEGVSLLRTYDAVSARDCLVKAVELEPSFAMGHDALSTAWAALGWDTMARDEARRAYDLSASLPRELQLRVEARYRESNYEWRKACDIWRGLATMFPDTPEYQLSLSADLTKAGSGREALAVIESLRRLPAPGRDDPRIDLAEAQAAANVSDNRRALSGAQAALRKATGTGARMIQAEALLSEGWAHVLLGSPSDAIAAYERAKQIAVELRDRDRVGVALVNIGMAYARTGDLTKARRAEEEAIEIFREVGDKKGLGRALYYLGHALYLGDDLLGAKRAYEEEIAICTEAGLQAQLQTTQIALATVLDQLGDLSEAMRMYAEGAKAGRSMGNKNLLASCLMNMVIVSLDMGDVAAAERIMPEALQVSRESQDKSQLASAIYDAAELLFAKGRTAEARSRYEECLSMWHALGQKEAIAETRVALSVLMIEDGDLGGAAALAAQAADEARTAGFHSTGCAAESCLARALLAQGNIGAAREALDRAALAGAQVTNPRYRISVAITAARALAQSQQKAEALASLQALRDEATAKHLIRLQYDARLAMAEVLMESQDHAAALRTLRDLERDARAGGFILYVNRVARLIPPDTSIPRS
ncbi:MAG: protein kinase [Acidobacteria bacterium]|nr:protein kinase [Acidobacteriota bacterium]